jgi:hypothetical protein
MALLIVPDRTTRISLATEHRHMTPTACDGHQNIGSVLGGAAMKD